MCCLCCGVNHGTQDDDGQPCAAACCLQTTVKSDVYSFGMTIMACMGAYIDDHITGTCTVPEALANLPDSLLWQELVLSCCNPDPTLRPLMREVVAVLHSLSSRAHEETAAAPASAETLVAEVMQAPMRKSLQGVQQEHMQAQVVVGSLSPATPCNSCEAFAVRPNSVEPSQKEEGGAVQAAHLLLPSPPSYEEALHCAPAPEADWQQHQTTLDTMVSAGRCISPAAMSLPTSDGSASDLSCEVLLQRSNMVSKASRDGMSHLPLSPCYEEALLCPPASAAHWKQQQGGFKQSGCAGQAVSSLHRTISPFSLQAEDLVVCVVCTGCEGSDVSCACSGHMSALPYSGSSSVRTGAETCSFGLMLEPGFYSGSLKEKEEHVSIEVREGCPMHSCSVSASSTPWLLQLGGGRGPCAGWWARLQRPYAAW